MRQYLNFTIALFLFISIGSLAQTAVPQRCNLTVKVTHLRNSTGSVLFALYNRVDAFPDEHYKKYFKILRGRIEHQAATVVFERLPIGKYAVNILHDENSDGKIQKGFILPIEGIGFSNYTTIGLSNRPAFDKASFYLSTDKEMMVAVIYF